MGTEDRSVPRHVRVARTAAQALIARHGVGFVRIWLLPAKSVPAVPVLAASAGAAINNRLGLEPAEAAALIATGAPTLSSFDRGASFVGVPLQASGVVFGYLEAYGSHPVGFASALQVERSAESLCTELASPEARRGVAGGASGTILVAGEAAMRRDVCTALAARDFAFVEASTVEATLELAREHHPDLIIIEWRPPSIDARAATLRLKAEAGLRPIPLVLLTDERAGIRRAAALDAGAEEALDRSQTQSALAARVEQMLRWRSIIIGTPEKAQEAKKPSRTAVARRTLDTIADYDRLEADAHSSETQMRYADAAKIYRAATALAVQRHDDDLANKYARLAGKMLLMLAETTDDPDTVEKAYVLAGKCFLEAGNLQLVGKSMDMASAFESVSESARQPG